jgi:hypothetical protein
MKIRKAYKGHVIEAMSLELRDNPGFVSQLFIEKHDGEGVTVTQFFVRGVFVSEEAALQATVLAVAARLTAGTEQLPKRQGVTLQIWVDTWEIELFEGVIGRLK